MFEASVDRLGRPVAGARVVEEREDVRAALFQGSTESANLDERGRNTVADTVDDVFHHRLALELVGFSVGGDDALVDTPGRFDFDVVIVGEHLVEPVTLLVGEEAVAGMKGAAGLVQRVTGPPSVPQRGLSDALSASVESVASETNNVEGVHHRNRRGQLFRGSCLEPAEPVHRDDLDPIPPLLGPSGEPLFEHGLRAALDHAQQPCRPAPVPVRGEIDDHGDVLVTLAGVSPDVLIHTDSGDVVEPVQVIEQPPLALSKDRRVPGGPRHTEPRGDAGDGEMIEDQARQPPRQSAAGDLRPRRCRLRGILSLDTPAPGALVPANTDQQGRGPVPKRFVRQAPGHRVPHRALAATLSAPLVRFEYPAFEHRALGRQVLPGNLEAELI